MASVDIIIMGLVARIEYEPNLLNGDRKANYENHDKFFESFINSNELLQSLLMAGWPKVAEGVWGKALEIASAYEAEHNNSIHKGTPYSFWGVTCILSGDLDMGFHLMHQALDEDKKTYGADFKRKPGYAIVKMDHTMVYQFFRDGVMQVAAFVEDKLQCYRASGAYTLNLDILRTKVLENDGLRVDVSFFLVYNFFRLKKLLDTKKAIRQNDFASGTDAIGFLHRC